MNTSSTAAARPEIWSKDLWQDVEDKLFLNVSGMSAKGGPDEKVNGVVHVMDDLEKSKGDTFTLTLTGKLGQNTGVSGDDELDGNESQLTPYVFSMGID